MLQRLKTFIKDHLPQESGFRRLLVRGQTCIGRFREIANVPWHWALPFTRIRRLDRFERKVYSQNGEDGILEAIFRKIGVTNRFAVEFGVEDGRQCNTRYLRERKGWTGLMMDPAENNAEPIKREFITAENINALFQKYGVPQEFDLLSIDVDGNDYWLWKALSSLYTPRVVVVEFNAKIPLSESKTITYEPGYRWDGSDYFGASLLAFVRLGERKGYRLIGCDSQGINAFFVRHDLIADRFALRPLETLYRPPRYGRPEDNGGWPRGSREMISV